MFNWLQSLLGPKNAPPAVRTAPTSLPPPLPAAPAAKKSAAKPRDVVRELILSGRAPDDLVAETVDLSDERGSFRLPSRLRCVDLLLANSSVAELPAGLTVANRIDLSGCANLRELPAGLRTGSLNLSACAALTALPENLAVHFLVLDGCTALHSWPESAQVTLGRVSAVGCKALAKLPETLGPLSTLRLRGCGALSRLPGGIRVVSLIEIDDALASGVSPELRALIRA